MRKKYFLICLSIFFLFFFFRFSEAWSLNVHIGEDMTITEMNWHEAWKTVPAPLNPGTLPPDLIEYWSTGNSTHTFVSTSSSDEGCQDAQSGDAEAIVGIKFFVEGEEGQIGTAEVTISYSSNAKSLLNGGGTADAILSELEYWGDIYRAICTTGPGPAPPISCQKTFGADESITFSMLLETGADYQIGVWTYSHADVCNGIAYAFNDFTIHSIEIKFVDGENQPPVASFTYSPENPVIHEEITFDASSSFDPDGDVLNYHWDFGDGISDNGVEVTHKFTKIGEFDVTLTVTDSAGLSDIEEKTIKIVCGVPAGADHKSLESIGDVDKFVPCPPVGIKEDVVWGIFGKKPGGILESNSGEKLQIRCEGIPGFLPSLKLYYAPPDGDFTQTGICTDPKKHACTIGMCPFEGGQNEIIIHALKDTTPDGQNKPDCFFNSTWYSLDSGWFNDKYKNPWTTEEELEDRKWDMAATVLDFKTMEVKKYDYKYNYLPGAWLIPWPKNDMLLDNYFVIQYNGDHPDFSETHETIFVDPPLGPETEAFFDTVSANIVPGAPMTEDPFAPCDFNDDGVCDVFDIELFMGVFGSCFGDDAYNPFADIDGSGCIDSDDEYFLFEQDTDNDGITDLADNCPADENIDQLDLDGDGIGYICDDEIQVPVDVKPQSCPNQINTRSKGLLPVAILGTNNFDISQIDTSTILLEGVSPIRYSEEDIATPFEQLSNKYSSSDCTEAGPDGIMDLTFKFNIQDIVSGLDSLEDGEVRVLKLTGNLLDGKTITGEDVIVILKK